ncbi:MAG: rRNA methyltransferase [Gammaproteobacteria bacterium]|nr:rRNA methyltransferase [Gammaproteobacteria bacterium]
MSEVLKSGELAIDATLGKGHDCLFLARHVTAVGHVWGFDIQPAALAETRRRLVEAGLMDTCTLCARGHEHMAAEVPANWRGRVGAVMFNLGYLPGGDKSMITHAGSTLAALDQAALLLRPGGLVSLLQYRGHAGAGDEVVAVDEWIDALPEGWRIQRHASPGPVLYLLEKRMIDDGRSCANPDLI